MISFIVAHYVAETANNHKCYLMKIVEKIIRVGYYTASRAEDHMLLVVVTKGFIIEKVHFHKLDPIQL